MKRLLLLVLTGAMLLSAAPIAQASTYVRGYYRSNGTYVAPYYRSNSDGYYWNNYSSAGNYNPYTGSRGYRSYYYYGR